MLPVLVCVICMTYGSKKLASFLDELSFVHDRDMRAEVLIEYAERYTAVPERIATKPYAENRKVPACESEVYMWTELQDDKTLSFYFAVENPQGVSAMAMAAIIDETLSGEPVEPIADLDESLVHTIFGKQLSMGKGVGLMNMLQMVKKEAKQHISY